MPILHNLSVPSHSVSLEALPHITCCMNLYLALCFNFSGSCASRTCKLFNTTKATTQPPSPPKTPLWCGYSYEQNYVITLFLIKLTLLWFILLMQIIRKSEIFACTGALTKLLRQVLTLILPGPVMVRVATDLLLSSRAA